MKGFFKEYKLHLFFIALLLLILGRACYYEKSMTRADSIEYVDTMGTYHKVYYEDDFKALKDENRALYDSLKKCKDEITYLIQFNAKNQYSTGVVHTSQETDSVVEAVTYEYTNEPNDTMNYTLRINAEKEPNWYSLDITTNNRYTIVNKTYDDGQNHLTIEGDGDISDVTVYKKKEKRGFWDRFSFGPGVTVGYDPINRNFGTTVGVTATFDLK